MGLYHIESLDRKYNDQILQILRESPIITENLHLYFDRHPDFFRLAEIKYYPHFYYGFFRLEKLMGFGMIGYHDANVNGTKETVFHLKDFYVLPEARGMGFGIRITERLFKETFNKAVTGYAVVMAGNKDPLGYIGHNNRSFPFFPSSRIINQLDVRNIMLIWPVREQTAFKIRRADIQDIPLIVSLLNNEHKDRLFGNVYSEDSFPDYLARRPGLSVSNYYLAFDKRGEPRGVCAAWDCSSFKQTRVLHYGKLFMPAIYAYKMLAAIFRIQSLPLPGESFREFIVTDYAVRDRDPGVMNALLRAVYNDYRKLNYQTMIWGSSADDPLLKASSGFFRQQVISNIVLISTDRSLIEKGAIRNYLPYIDIPCL
jgi:GNAT superfamily N-acetyltransferase